MLIMSVSEMSTILSYFAITITPVVGLIATILWYFHHIIRENTRKQIDTAVALAKLEVLQQVTGKEIADIKIDIESINKSIVVLNHNSTQMSADIAAIREDINRMRNRSQQNL